MYSKLFTAGLAVTSNSTCPSPVGEPPSTRPSMRRRSTDTAPSSKDRDYFSRPSHVSHPSTSSLFSPGSIEIISPTSSVPEAGNGIFFTFKARTRPSAAKQSRRAFSNDENDMRSFLSLDLAESVRSASIRSKRFKVHQRLSKRMSSVGEESTVRSFVSPPFQSTRKSMSGALPKRKPSPVSILPLLPTEADHPHPLSARTFVPSFSLKHSPSLVSSLRPSPSVMRANRIHALAALEGRHTRSFWEDDEHEHDTPETFAPSSFSSSSSVATSTPLLETPPPPSNPLQAMDVNVQLSAEPVVSEAQKADKWRPRSNTIESWFIPSLNIDNYLDDLEDASEHQPGRGGEKEDDENMWHRLVGTNLAILS